MLGLGKAIAAYQLTYDSTLSCLGANKFTTSVGILLIIEGAGLLFTRRSRQRGSQSKPKNYSLDMFVLNLRKRRKENEMK